MEVKVEPSSSNLHGQPSPNGAIAEAARGIAVNPSSGGFGRRAWLLVLPTNWIDRLLGYDVFISYAWSDGRAYAESLSATLRRGTSWRDRLAVFLDDEEVEVGSPLQATIRRALRRSSILVVVATPLAIRSVHVADEVRAFKLLDRSIVPIAPANLVPRFRQQISSTSSAGELPDNVLEATPEACERLTLATLRQYIWVEEAADVANDAPSAIVVQKIRNAVGGLRRARLRFAALLAVTVVFLGLAIAAYLLRNEAVAQQQRAEENERLAVSRQLAAQSTALAGMQLDRALLLALAAKDVEDTQAADQALLNAVSNGPPIVAYLRAHAQPVTAILPLAGSAGGGAMLTADMASHIASWTREGQKLTSIDLASGPIKSLVQMSDGTIAVGSYDGVVSLLARDDLSLIGRISNPRVAGQSASVIWRSSAAELIVGYSGSDVQPGVAVRWSRRPNGDWSSDSQLQLGAVLTSLALSPDGAALAIGTANGQVLLWDFGKGKEAVQLRHVNRPNPRQPETYIKALAFHPNGKRLAYDDGDGAVHIVDLEDFQSATSAVCHIHRNDVYGIAFLGDLLLSVGSDAKLRVARTGSGCAALVDYQVTGKSLQSVAALDAGASLVVTGSGDGSAQLWNLARLAPGSLTVATGPIVPSSIAFTPDDRSLALTGVATDPDTRDRGFVRAYRASDLTPQTERLRDLRGPATAVLFAQGQTPVIIGFDGWLTWPDLNSGAYSNPGHLPGNATVWPGDLFAARARAVVIAHIDGSIALHDATTGAMRWRRSLWPNGPDVRSAAISPDGTRVAIGADNGWIQVLDGATGKEIGAPLTEHRLGVTGLSFGRDANLLYSGSIDARLLIWKLDTRTATPIEHGQGSIQAIALAADERLFAASTQRGVVALWSGDGTRFLGTLSGGIATPITALRFDHAGNRLAAASMTGGTDPGKLVLWDVGMDNLRTRACAIAARSLTAEERAQFGVPSTVKPCQP